jgi:hypothetical protein
MCFLQTESLWHPWKFVEAAPGGPPGGLLRDEERISQDFLSSQRKSKGWLHKALSSGWFSTIPPGSNI